jgi:hypothetical protein
METEGDSGSRKSTTPAVLVVIVLVLSLATWLVFYLLSLPLTATDTPIVVGAWLLFVFMGNWLWRSLRKKKKPE